MKLGWLIRGCLILHVRETGLIGVWESQWIAFVWKTKWPRFGLRITFNHFFVGAGGGRSPKKTCGFADVVLEKVLSIPCSSHLFFRNCSPPPVLLAEGMITALEWTNGSLAKPKQHRNHVLQGEVAGLLGPDSCCCHCMPLLPFWVFNLYTKVVVSCICIGMFDMRAYF